MAITATKTDEIIRLVHVDDPDVQMSDPDVLGWVPFDMAKKVSTGATCVGVSPLSKRIMMAADGDTTFGSFNAGSSSYQMAVEGLSELGTWHGDKLKWQPMTKPEAESWLESVGSSEAVWQLAAVVRRISNGQQPVMGADPLGDGTQ